MQLCKARVASPGTNLGDEVSPKIGDQYTLTTIIPIKVYEP